MIIDFASKSEYGWVYMHASGVGGTAASGKCSSAYALTNCNHHMIAAGEAVKPRDFLITIPFSAWARGA